MQILRPECVHRFITTDTEDVCTNCGCVKHSSLSDDMTVEDITHNSPLSWESTPIHSRFLRTQRWTDQKYVSKNRQRARNLIDLFCKELGIEHDGLKQGTLDMFRRSSSRNLVRGLNMAISVSACLYVTAQRLHITVTLVQLADIVIKQDLVPQRARNHRGLRRHIQRFIYRLASRCIRTNDIKPVESDIHPVVIMVSRVASRHSYDQGRVKQCIEAINTLLAADATVFAGRKPAGEAAILLCVYLRGTISQVQLATDFRVSETHIYNNLIRIKNLLDKYGIKHPEISCVWRPNSLD
jgi:transcription initiation factor TFIIIB Brf1 subunit/transcription initiation factor TFIIB